MKVFRFSGLFLLVLICSLASLTAQKKPKNVPPPSLPTMQNQTDSISYALGLDVGQNLKTTGLDVNIDQIYQGLKAALAEADTVIDEATRAALLQTFQQMITEKKQREQEQKAALALEEGRLFLEENGKREGVITTASGLQYEILREGDGPKPGPASTVNVHYEGKLLDDSIFDSSYKRGQPLDLQLNRVIAGWTEGIQLMKTGAKHRLFIPAELGYGARGAGGQIGPNEVLIFDVELLDVK